MSAADSDFKIGRWGATMVIAWACKFSWLGDKCSIELHAIAIGLPRLDFIERRNGCVAIRAIGFDRIAPAEGILIGIRCVRYTDQGGVVSLDPYPRFAHFEVAQHRSIDQVRMKCCSGEQRK